MIRAKQLMFGITCTDRPEARAIRREDCPVTRFFRVEAYRGALLKADRGTRLDKTRAIPHASAILPAPKR